MPPTMTKGHIESGTGVAFSSNRQPSITLLTDGLSSLMS
jgi:hypothetical protein